MKALAILLMVGLIGCGKPHVVHEVASGQIGIPVTVTDCNGKLVAVYADKELTAPMANPIYPSPSGTVSFWTTPHFCFGPAPKPSEHEPYPISQAFKERVSERDAWEASTLVLWEHASRADKDRSVRAFQKARLESMASWDEHPIYEQKAK